MLYEGQAGYRLIMNCVDNVYTLNELVQGRSTGEENICIFLRYTESNLALWSLVKVLGSGGERCIRYGR